MYIYILNDVNITDQQFTLGGVTYPSSWCHSASNSNLDVLGIHKLEVIYPTISVNQLYPGSYTDSLLLGTRTYNVLTKTYPILGDNERYTNTYTDDLIAGTRTYDVETFTVSAPIDIPLWKLRARLTVLGMIDGVNAAINSLSDPDKTYAKIGFEYANSVERMSPTVTLLKIALSLSDSDVDDIFITASKLSA